MVTIEINEYGEFCYYYNGIFHSKDDLPSIIQPNGSIKWYLYGNLHRDNGPAIIYSNGVEVYFDDGEIHRDDAPAIIYSRGTVEYYSFGNLRKKL